MCLSIGVLAGCSGDDAGGDDAAGSAARVEWSSLGETAYIVADELPEGWSLSHATERRGRPPDEWEDHLEIYSTSERDRFLIVGAHQGVREGPIAPGEVEVVDAEELGYLLVFTVGSFPDGAAAAQTSWSENGFSLFVAEIAPEPDADLITSVAEDLRGLEDLDFEPPRPPAASGYEPVAASPGFPDDVTDYTVVWRPDALAGDDRESGSASGNEGPSLWINVGCAFYAQAPIAIGIPTGPDEAEVRTEGGLLDLEYVLAGSTVRVSGRDVDEAELRAFAEGLRVVGRDEWAEALGSRLLVDEPEG